MPLLLADRAATSSPLPLTTTAEARMLGIRVSAPTYQRLRRGVYVDRVAYDRLPPWKRYVVRVHAFVRVHPDAILCLESAAVVHGLPLFGETEHIHVFDPDLSASRRVGDVFMHASLDPRDRDDRRHPCHERARHRHGSRARPAAADSLALADSAISPVQGGSITVDELRTHADGQVNRRGRARLRWVWEHADGRSESPAESVSRAVMLWSGFETPELQREFGYDGCRDRTDFYFRANRAIGEADGWQKYALEDPEAAARALADEKRREDRLRRHGHPFARWDLTDAWKVAPLVRALELAGVRRARPAQPAMLATLAHRPRAKSPTRRPDGASNTSPPRP